ncbi:MAG: efflux RND transporter periplasmic adaptor subunit [Chlorobiota bacterium]|nr:MAG: efflux RND transporter periplasmic adaptor subunit [Chlorobiota bacterium]
MNGIKYSLLILTLFSFLFIGCSGNENSKDNKNEKPKAKEYWTCTMHPQVRMDGPGACPICGMDLIKKTEEPKEPASSSATDMEKMVSLSGEKQILANVSIVKVLREKLTKEISVYSYLDFAEQSRKVISARFSGRIEKLFVDRTGQYIKKGEPLFEIYSPDLVQAQNDYLIAIGNKQSSEYNSTGNSGTKNDLKNSARKKLELLGITDNQIKELDNSGEIKLTITYYSPYSGTVIEKKVQEGMYVSEGSSIYEIADLSLLWNIAEVYENDLNVIKPGSKMELILQAFPGETFTGRISFVYPVVNPETRTIKIRSEIQNKGNKLRPNMYGQTIFKNNFGDGLIIPSDAILFSGKRNIVWVRLPDGMFESREVKVGNKFGDNYQILSGLKEGEEVAATGGFLIDSESQLKSGMPTGHQHGEVDQEKKEVNDHSQHSSEEMKNMNEEKDIVNKRDVKVSTLDINKDGFVYQCPMDWEVISDKPGTCPLCKMDLKKFTVNEAQKNLIEYP